MIAIDPNENEFPAVAITTPAEPRIWVFHEMILRAPGNPEKDGAEVTLICRRCRRKSFTFMGPLIGGRIMYQFGGDFCFQRPRALFVVPCSPVCGDRIELVQNPPSSPEGKES